MTTPRCFSSLLLLLALALVGQPTSQTSESLDHSGRSPGAQTSESLTDSGRSSGATTHTAVHSLVYIQTTTFMSSFGKPRTRLPVREDKLSQTEPNQLTRFWQMINIPDAKTEDLEHQEMSHQKLDNEEIKHKDLKHQNLKHKDLNHQDVKHQAISRQDVIHQDVSHQEVNHQDVSRQNVIHQDVSHQEVNHQDVSRQDVNHQDVSRQEPRSNSLLAYLPLIDWIMADNSPQESQILPLCHLEANATKANCSYLALTNVPSEGIPHTIIYLDLSHNNIRKLSNWTFVNYKQLRYLNLSDNNIAELEELAFSGLNRLEVLNLWRNSLATSKSTFADSIFGPLVHLRELTISRNNENCQNTTGLDYPDKALSRLTSLRTLRMDGLKDAQFGPGFGRLTQLVRLEMVGWKSGCCHLNSLTSDTFRHFPHVEHLDISSCYIQGKLIDPGAFSHLRNLTYLDLTHNEDIDIQNLDHVFLGLSQAASLAELRVNLIVNRYSIGICLDSFFIRNFPQHLEHFMAQENSLEGLDRSVLRVLPPSLKTLDVSGNKFVFGTYLHDLHILANLTVLKLNGGGFTYNLPQLYPFQSPGPTANSNCTLYGLENPIEPFILKLPPKLQVVEMKHAGLTYNLSPLNVDPDNVLQSLSMRGNKFPSLEGPFLGLDRLTSLDLSSSYVQNIQSTFFANLTSMEMLYLNDNLLGDFFSMGESASVFLPLVNLTLLNLSFNYINKLQDNVFAGLANLRTLVLSKNTLGQFCVNISHMHNLQHVDLSRNRIVNLPTFTRQHIDMLLSRGHNVTFDLSMCPISCTCDNFKFLVWMKGSRAFDPEFRGYDCVFEDNLSQQIIDGFNSTIQSLRRECPSQRLLLLCVAGIMCVVFCVVLCSILYRFRWKLRYLYYAAHLLLKSNNRCGPSTQFEYDAFISYDESDERFVVNRLSLELEKRGLRLCIHGRDFRAGEYIASNIVRAVCSSRKTVVVLTRQMVASYWCGYEIQMANMEAVHTGRLVLIFLLKEHIPDHELSKELLYHIRSNTYIPYPESLPDATSIGRLWDKLVADIRD